MVDSWTTLNEATLDLLDLSDEIVTLMTLGQRPELLVLGYLRNQRLLSDFIKASVFISFASFILVAPKDATIVHSTAYFCCIGTILSYLQNFNFAVRRQLTP